jgi:uncharacterized protein YbaA (DUF1428 family)
MEEFGASELFECFEDDVPEGKQTDFRRAVAAEPGEHISFSWIVWPSKEVRNAANERMRNDPRMEAFADVPFDMKRMIFGGFEPIFHAKASGNAGD